MSSPTSVCDPPRKVEYSSAEPAAFNSHARHGLAAQSDFAIFSWRVGDESTSSAKHRERQSLSKTKLKTLAGNLPPPPPAWPPADRIRQISCNVWQRRETGGRRLAVERSEASCPPYLHESEPGAASGAASR